MFDNEESVQTDVETTELQQALEGPATPESTPVESVKPKTEVQPENFRILRDKLDNERKLRESMEQRLAEIESRNTPKQQAQPEEDLNFNIGDNDIAEGKHLTKVGRRMKQLEDKIAEVENKRMQLERQSQENSIVSSIKADFPDIDKVVNESTMEALRVKYPHLEKTIKSSPDLYSKAAAAYQAIKDLGLYVEDNYVAERERVQRNIAKPKPTAVVAGTGTPLSQADMFANGLTPELKDQLHKEMLAAMKAR